MQLVCHATFTQTFSCCVYNVCIHLHEVSCNVGYMLNPPAHAHSCTTAFCQFAAMIDQIISQFHTYRVSHVVVATCHCRAVLIMSVHMQSGTQQTYLHQQWWTGSVAGSVQQRQPATIYASCSAELCLCMCRAAFLTSTM